MRHASTLASSSQFVTPRNVTLSGCAEGERQQRQTGRQGGGSARAFLPNNAKQMSGSRKYPTPRPVPHS